MLAENLCTLSGKELPVSFNNNKNNNSIYQLKIFFVKIAMKEVIDELKATHPVIYTMLRLGIYAS